MSKNLSNYFDEWIYVDHNNDNTDVENGISELTAWCVENFGIRGLKWDCRWMKFRNNNPKIRSEITNKFCWMFKTEQDALMFILKYGGNVIDINNLYNH
jgi:hypothetical protein